MEIVIGMIAAVIVLRLLLNPILRAAGFAEITKSDSISKSSIKEISSLSSFKACLVIFVLAFLGFTLTERAINSASGPSKENLEVFDKKYGYSESTFLEVQRAWGHEGRMYYLLFEALDLCFFCFAYRGLLTVLFNRLQNKVAQYNNGFFTSSAIYMLPVTIVLIDYVEGFFHVGLTLVYDRMGEAAFKTTFKGVVFYASLVNQIKWTICIITGLVLLLLWGYSRSIDKSSIKSEQAGKSSSKADKPKKQ